MAASWAARLTPEPFRDFLPYTSLSALKVIHTGQVLERALRIVQHSGSEGARARGAESLSRSLSAAGLDVVIARAPLAPLNVERLDAESRAKIGAHVLRLYFHQLYAEGPWFLDLRPRHFSWDEATQRLHFYPSNLCYQPECDFKRRVQALYEGFYRGDRQALSAGFALYGWACTPRPGFAARIEQLLSEHFGPGDSPEMLFRIAHFRETFDCIFREASESGAKLHPELTFLGVGLVGLYLTLEQLAVPLYPRRAFDASAPLRPGTQLP